MEMEMGRKRTKGKRKIEMKLIENVNARRVTLCKRRNGAFKKASELVTLCGVDAAVIVTSMSDKVYSFGSPSVEVVMDRYLNFENRRVVPNIGNHHDGPMNALNQRINEINEQLDQLDKEKKSRSATEQGQEGILKAHIGKQNKDGLEKLMKLMVEFKENVALRKREVPSISEASNSSRSGKEVITSSTKNDGNESSIPVDWLKL